MPKRNKEEEVKYSNDVLVMGLYILAESMLKMKRDFKKEPIYTAPELVKDRNDLLGKVMPMAKAKIDELIAKQKEPTMVDVVAKDVPKPKVVAKTKAVSKSRAPKKTTAKKKVVKK